MRAAAIGLGLACLSCSEAGPGRQADGAGAWTWGFGRGVTVERLRCEYRADPLGIDVRRPRLSWTLVSDQRGQRQTACQIQVATSRADLLAGRGDLWDTGKVETDRSIQVEYAGRPLRSGMAAFWRVRVWDKDGRVSPWSEPARWTMGLFDPSDWKGQWIGLDETETSPAREEGELLKQARWIWYPEGDPARSAPPGTRFFRCTMDLPADRPIREARCLVAADDGGTVFVGGRKAGACSSFQRAVPIKVGPHLKPGRNVLAVAVRNAGDAPNPAGLLAGLRIDFAQGEPLVVATDARWRAFDKEVSGWQNPDFDDSGWPAARELGACGMAPWGEVSVAASEQRRLAARMLRREFDVGGAVARATVYVCGLGYHELRLNGRKVGDAVLDPGLTEYTKRALYVTYDVTELLRAGGNAVGVWLGNGRYFAPRIKDPFPTETYGYPKMLLQMQIDYADGRSAVVVSDGAWKLTTEGPIRANNDYDGEEYDARLEQAGWDAAGFDDARWQPARVVQPPGGVLAAQMAEPIKVTQTVTPVAMTNPRPGLAIYDLGQNIVGWAALTVQGPRGTRVAMRFAETLTPEGLLFTDNLRSCQVTDVYVLKGDGVERYEPRFTYHGFRYVELSGYPGTPGPEAIRGRVVHSAVEPAGSFECSNETLNRVHRNMRWGIRGNLRSIPTDCPQRDERHGWLGDIANESKAESFDFGVAAFFTKWLDDIRDAQDEKGQIPDVAPPFWRMYNGDVTWPATYVILPGLMYLQYGDVRLLERHYPSMKKFLAFIGSTAEGGIVTKDTYGDWCVPPESPDLIHSKDPARKTAGPLLATAYYCHLLRLVGHTARILGHADEADRCGAEADKVARAFHAKWFNPSTGLYDNGTQTSCVLPLAFGIVPPEHRRRLFDALVENIAQKTDHHIGTGLIGGQWLMRALSDGGRADLAYTLAAQKTYPSWGYMAEKGATTIWELWNGDTADPAMNSHNHLMLTGDLGIWLYEYLAGIQSDPKQPGFKHVLMRPRPVGDLSFVRATHQSPYGQIASEWRLERDALRWKVRIPPNATATLFVPAAGIESIREGGRPVAGVSGLRFVRMEDGCAVIEAGSGSYDLRAAR